MRINSSPERNLAARLISKKRLAPPIDIFHLAEQYAKVDSLFIPFDVDGISLHLKVPGRNPHIIINESNPERRIRFTLAHELGHVLIPWHIGSIIDKTSVPEEDKFDEYWYLEAEANRFASELLMPSIWVKGVFDRNEYDISKIAKYIVKKANVSSDAATIKIKDSIDPGYLFVALTEDNEVRFSGRSEGTLAAPPAWGEEISPEDLFPFCKKRFNFEINGFYYYWWHFENN